MFVTFQETTNQNIFKIKPMLLELFRGQSRRFVFLHIRLLLEDVSAKYMCKHASHYRKHWAKMEFTQWHFYIVYQNSTLFVGEGIFSSDSVNYLLTNLYEIIFEAVNAYWFGVGLFDFRVLNGYPEFPII